MWRATLSRSPGQRRTLLLQLRKADSNCFIRVLLPLWGQGALSVTVSHCVREPSQAELEALGAPAHQVAHAAGACDLFVAGVVPEVGDLGSTCATPRSRGRSSSSPRASSRLSGTSTPTSVRNPAGGLAAIRPQAEGHRGRHRRRGAARRNLIGALHNAARPDWDTWERYWAHNPRGDGSVFAAGRRSPSEQVKRHTERRRTAADEGESGAMVVKDRRPHLRGHPADSSGSVVIKGSSQ
jgi:hypothetical protein